MFPSHVQIALAISYHVGGLTFGEKMRLARVRPRGELQSNSSQA
jgi:hypothetical protein